MRCHAGSAKAPALGSGTFWLLFVSALQPLACGCDPTVGHVESFGMFWQARLVGKPAMRGITLQAIMLCIAFQAIRPTLVTRVGGGFTYRPLTVRS